MGAGRWSEVLQPLAKKLILVDISKKCLEICKKRFENFDNIEYYLFKERLNVIEDNTIDYIWSYEVFVHINHTETRKFIEDFSRILKPNGCAIIHHSGKYSEDGFRAPMDNHTFNQIVKENELIMIEQNDSLPHRPGDTISVFLKPLNHNT